MLKLTLLPDEYLMVGNSIVVQLLRVSGGVDAAVDHLPLPVRGAVLERQGGKRPACLEPPPKKKARYYRDQVFRWNDDRERAVRSMKQVFERLEQKGAGEEAKILRTQLDRIIPAFWEDDLASQ